MDLGIGAVMATLGPAGAVLVTGEGAWHATAPEVPVVSTVGAGDSSVAGYILADVRGGDEAERLRTAMAYGSAAASLPGTTLPTPARPARAGGRRHPARLSREPAGAGARTREPAASRAPVGGRTDRRTGSAADRPPTVHHPPTDPPHDHH